MFVCVVLVLCCCVVLDLKQLLKNLAGGRDLNHYAALLDLGVYCKKAPGATSEYERSAVTCAIFLRGRICKKTYANAFGYPCVWSILIFKKSIRTEQGAVLSFAMVDIGEEQDMNATHAQEGNPLCRARPLPIADRQNPGQSVVRY